MRSQECEHRKQQFAQPRNAPTFPAMRPLVICASRVIVTNSVLS